MGDIRFISIETDVRALERKLLKSCDVHGIDLDVIGKGVEWDGFITKFKVLSEHLPKISEKFVCLTDSRDVLYMSGGDVVYDTYIRNFNTGSIVFNGETNCFPEPELAGEHPNQNKKYKYLNSGCVIGNRDTLIRVVENALALYDETGYNDDQYLLQRLFLEGNGEITLDYDCKIFQCVWDEEWGRSNNFDLIYTKDRIYNRLTDTYPSIFHFPGPTTTDSQAWKILNNKYGYIENRFF